MSPSDVSEIDAMALIAQVSRIARKLKARSFCFEDCVSAGLVAALDGLRRFNPSRGASLDTYLSHRIRGGILDYYRKAEGLTGIKREEPRPEPTSCFTANDWDRSAPEHHVNGGVDLATKRDVAHLLALCRVRERTALMLRYKSELPNVAIAQLMGIGEARVWQLQHKGISRMRKACAR